MNTCEASIRQTKSVRSSYRIRFSSAWVAFAMAMGLLTPLCAGAHEAMSFPHALTPAFRWSEPVEMQLSGMPVSVRSFVATLTLEQAAQLMARHERRFQRVTTLPGAILLSGLHKGRHWVAQLEAAPGHTKGIVSTLPLDAASIEAGTPGFLTPWLTQNARFVFGQSSNNQGRRVTQSIHVPEQPLDAFVGALDRRLTKAGWQRQGMHSWRGGAANSAVSSHIDVIPVSIAQGAGNAIFVNQSE